MCNRNHSGNRVTYDFGELYWVSGGNPFGYTGADYNGRVNCRYGGISESNTEEAFSHYANRGIGVDGHWCLRYCVVLVNMQCNRE